MKKNSEKDLQDQSEKTRTKLTLSRDTVRSLRVTTGLQTGTSSHTYTCPSQ